MFNKTVKKYLLVFAGSVSITLGVVGLVVPILPTTPFLLLAAYCYLRSSKRLYNWLVGHKYLGSYIQNYIKYRAVHIRTKIFALVMLWISLLVSILVVNNIYIRLGLLVIGLAVSVHILTLKTMSATNQQPDRN